MRILNEQEMWNSITLSEVMDAIEKAYAIHRQGNYIMPDRYVAAKDKNMMLYMPCFTDEVIGTKMLAEFPDNPKKGFPYLSGLMILNDAATGVPKAIMNGGVLTAIRTGAVGGVGLRYLSREDSSSVGLVGCGTQGFHQLLYACALRPIQNIYLFDAFVDDLAPFRERLAFRLNRPDIKIHICTDIRQLVIQSDILISATQAVTPVYPDDPELLRGKCFIAIGSWRPQRRELPDALLSLVKNVYTEMPYAMEETGDLCIPLASGILTRDRVLYMEDLIHDTKSGHPHQLSETRVFKSVGMGLFDACVAQLIFENAVKKDIGQKIIW